jgi:gamma-glutamyltranspeptidase/glutathione hydrolase
MFYPENTMKSACTNKSMVVAATTEAVEAGISVLRQGGNAVDAAAAAAFALVVTDPAMCSLGGRSQVLIYLAESQIVGIDGATQTPGKVSGPSKRGYGYQTCAILGTPAALEEMVAEYGTLPLRLVMKPAIQLARDGFIIKKDYQELFEQHQKTLRRYPGTVKHFLKEDGTCYAEGDRFCQPTLARTLEMIADEGSGEIYRGKLAQAIAKDMANNNGLIKKDDLAQYHTLAGEIVEGEYRGYKIVSRGDQCDGASVIEMLHILEHFPLSDYEATDPIYLHLLAQALYIGFADELLPDWQQVSKALASRRVREIDQEKALPVPIDPAGETGLGDTNHLSVLDEDGNAVSLTQSIGPPFGSKVANPELGFLYAYSYDMHQHPTRYYREKSSQSPTIAFHDGKPFMVLGSAGSVRIPASIVQTIVNVIDHKMTIENAVASPRVFLTDRHLNLEAFNVSDSTLGELEKMGYAIKAYPQLDGWFGRVHAILTDPVREEICGASDPRDNGSAGGF